MKKLAFVAFTAGAVVVGAAGAASAQAFYFGFDPGYRQHYGPPSYYYSGPQYYYDGPRYRYRSYPRRGRYLGGWECGPGWSLQDGVCKPYRGY